MIIITIILVIFAGLRGDFTADYKNYETLFYEYNKLTFGDIFRVHLDQEIGYVLLNWLIGRLTANFVWVMISCSSVTILLFIKEFKKESNNVWLSIFLFVTIGSYYVSFNLTRQIMATAIIFFGSSYLYEKKLIKYVWIIFTASLFHKTALVMIPFYFILNFKFNF